MWRLVSKLKKRMDALGVAADLACPGSHAAYESNADFFIANLTRNFEKNGDRR